MSAKQETAATADEVSTKNGEKNFNEEIKDYAKTTMNELLGMFGYDEEITSESVNNLDIKVPASAEESSTASATSFVTALPSVTVAMVTAQTSTPGVPAPVILTSSLPLTVPEDSSDDTPVIVKVEGNTSVSDIIRQQNGINTTSNANETTSVTSPEVTTATQSAQAITTQVTLPMSVAMASQSGSGQPALVNKLITGFTKPFSLNATPIASKPAAKNLSPYLQSIVQSQTNRSCTWCKQTTILKNFTFRDGTRILECRNICSQECFEMAALSIELNNENIKSIQRRIKQLRESKTSPAKGPEAAASGTNTVRRHIKDKSQVARPLFNWEHYLRESRGRGAALWFFKQSSTPPHNGFKPGMKLEVADPRVIKSTCLATVVGSIGPRIRCGFDGTDKSNDVWHMVDSTEIHPVGWCEANVGQLQPPVGFTNDPGRYQKFVATTLATAGVEKVAPARLFRKEPDPPDKNMFITGMKLEAVDPKNQALVCVCSVGEVDGEKIRIDFDGYLGSDYWCRFDSRNIFPVGWCTRNGHPLQPPGKSKKRLNVPSTSRTKTKEEHFLTKKTKTHPRLSSPLSPTSKSASSSSITQESVSSSQPTVSLYVNYGCKTGRYLNKSKVVHLQSPWFGKVSEIIQPLIQGLVDSAYDQKTVFGFLKPGHGKTTITARVADGSEILSCSLQCVDRVRIFWKVLDRFLENLQCCDNLISGTKIKGRCEKCRGKAVPRPLKRPSSVSAESPTSKASRHSDNDVSSPQVCSTSPVKTWSVDEVIKYLESTELADYVSLFKIHEIDGRALLLLNRDMIMSYMGLKLGPAIKLLNIVDDLKPQEIVEVE